MPYPILDCRTVTRLVSQGLDRRLGLGRRVALRLHYGICAGCRNFRGQMDFLRSAMRRLPDADGPRDNA